MSRRPTSGREIARRVLLRVRRDGAYASLALSAALGRAGDLPARDRALATELTYGVLRHRRLLDEVLARHSRRPIARMDPDVLDVLRVAAYQLLLLDRTPAHAAVNHAVATVRRLRGAALAGFANAVLRRVSPADRQAVVPDASSQRLAVGCSLPDALARHWERQLGPHEAWELGQSLLERAGLTIRVNTSRASPAAVQRALEGAGARVCPGRWAPGALHVADLSRPFDTPSYVDGLWTAQDEAAQLVALAAAPAPGELVVDVCAGLGGKALHMAEVMEDRGRIIGLDVSRSKLTLLADHRRRLGIGCCAPVQADLRRPAPLRPGVADRVVVDAPCTGLGVLRRHPELKWARGLDRLEELVAVQRQLLDRAAVLVRPGGTLIYSVCTTTDEEGPQMVEWLCAAHPELERAELALGPPDARGEPGTVRLWPHRHGTDGFFIARLRRAEP